MFSAELQLQSKLESPGLARRENLPEEWAKVGVLARYAPVRMIQQVERFQAKLQAHAFGQRESALQGQIENLSARRGQNIASRVAPGVLGRDGKRIHVEPLLGSPVR